MTVALCRRPHAWRMQITRVPPEHPAGWGLPNCACTLHIYVPSSYCNLYSLVVATSVCIQTTPISPAAAETDGAPPSQSRNAPAASFDFVCCHKENN
jgi:hypothetical protein